MNFKKQKFLIYIIPSFILAIGIFYVLFFLQSTETKTLNNFETIPPNAICIFSINQPIGFSSKIMGNTIIRSLENKKNLKSIFETFSNIEDIFSKDKKTRDLIKGNPILFSLYQEKDQISSLINIRLNQKINLKDLKRIVSQNMNNVIFTEMLYKEIRILQVKNKAIYFYIIQNNLLISSNFELAKQGIDCYLNKQSILVDLKFKEVQKAAGKNVDLNIYINFKRILPDFIQIENTNPILSSAGWSVFDYTINKNDITLNGITIPEINNSYLKLIEGQTASETQIQSIIPSNTSFLTDFTFSNSSIFIQELQKLTGNKDSLDYNYNLMDNEIGYVTIDKGDFIAVKINNSKETYSYLKEFSYPTIEHYEDFQIYKLKQTPKFINALNLYKKDTLTWYTIIDNFLIIAKNKDCVNEVVLNYSNKTIFENAANYLSISKNLTSKSGIFLYIDTKKADQKVFNPIFFANISSLSMQINTNDKNCLNSIFLTKTDSTTLSTPTNPNDTIESNLKNNEIFDSEIIKMEVFENRQSKTNTIFAVDQNNKLYALDNAGKINWTQQIDGNSLGDIQPIDLYKNGKQQYFFNTNNKIYIVDKLGRFAENYPLTLKSTSNSNISLIDFDKNRTYSYIFPNAERIIQCIDEKGKPVIGWKAFKTQDYVYKALKYAQIGGVFVLICQDKSNNIYLLDRHGKKIAQTKSKVKLSANNNFYLANYKGTANFVTTTANGEVLFINNKAEIETMKLRNFSETHYFLCADINNDQKNEFIFGDNNTLYVYNNDKKNLFTLSFDKNICEMPKIVKLNRIAYIQVQTKAGISLVNNKGAIIKSIPLDTKIGLIYIKSENTLNLISTHKKSINYKKIDL